MIYIDIIRSEIGLIETVTISGHAEYDVPGKDIVCAGVSAVSIGTINAVEALCGTELPVIQEHGFLQVDIPSNLEGVIHEKVQLLMEGMVVSLQTIEFDYSEYIDILVKGKKE
jgi:uncharacterized protein YsxB (DUF464 family)